MYTGIRALGWFLASAPRFRAIVLEKHAHLIQAFRLRGKVFGESLGWVDCDAETGDQDAFDEAAVHFGVCLSDTLLAYCRILPSDRMMLGSDLNFLLQGTAVRQTRNTVELSRLVVEPELLGERTAGLVQLLLMRRVYRWSVEHGKRYVYFATALPIFEKFRHHFNLREVARAHPADMRVPAVVAAADFRECEDWVYQNNRPLYWWFTGTVRARRLVRRQPAVSSGRSA
jgi:N-acyl-L-homoserine lactone synthetase